MATSGTIGKTNLNCQKIIDKALRRCGLNPLQQTPEIVENALEDLFLLIMSLANRGLNLWCVEKRFFSLTENQARYTLPDGTQALLNVIHSLHSIQEPESGVMTAQSATADFGEETPIRMVRLGFRFAETIPTEELTFEYSDDDLNYYPLEPERYSSVSPDVFAAEELYWADVKVIRQFRYLRITRTNNDPIKTLTVQTLYPVIQSSEIQITQFNRDDYSAQPTKYTVSQRPTNFYFEKLVDPTITLWPIPNSEQHCLTLYRYRQIQDIGDLQNDIEIPVRWLEAITWHLALRLAYEIPGGDARIQTIQQMAQGMVIEVEADETDSAPVYFQPNIRVYTR